MVGEQKCVFQISFLKYLLKTVLTIEINHITNVNYLDRVSGANVGKNLHSGRLTFGREKKSIEGSRSMKFTHNVDYDLITIT